MSLLKRFRNRRKRDRLYLPPPEQGFMNFLKKQMMQRGLIPTEKRFIPNKRLGILLNRYCNLNCFSCSAIGRNPPKDETTLDEIQAYIKNIEGYYPESVFMLTGGEPTAIDHGKLEKICSLIHERGHKTAILTNGFRLIPVEWIDYVVLDRHGINDDAIAKWKKHLKIANRENYDVFDTLWHMDIAYSLKDNITVGARCSSWTNTITLWKDVVYPCCTHMHMAVWDSEILDQKLASNLRDAGWNAYNPDLVETIRNWRETLPGEAFRVCSIKCWKHSSKTRWVKIT